MQLASTLFYGDVVERLVELKRAAAEIEYAGAPFGYLPVQLLWNPVNPLLAVLFSLDKTGFAKHLQVAGNVVLADAEFACNIVHAHLPGKQQAQHPEAGFLAEGAKRGNTADGVHVLVIPSRKDPMQGVRQK